MAQDLKGKALWVFVGLLSALYLANLGAGIIELSPDNLPLIGNIDEFIFSVLLMKSLAELGLAGFLKKSDGS